MSSLLAKGLTDVYILTFIIGVDKGVELYGFGKDELIAWKKDSKLIIGD